MQEVISTVTEKGQATIPKALREKHGIGRKVLVIDTRDGVLLKGVPDPSTEKGSLKGLFGRLILYLGEEGAEKVATSLKQVLEGDQKGFINVVNLAELYYILARRSRREAEEKERNLRSYGVGVVSVGERDELWKAAATINANNALSLADAFAAATAMALKAKLVAGGDEEFGGIKGLEVERVG